MKAYPIEDAKKRANKWCEPDEAMNKINCEIELAASTGNYSTTTSLLFLSHRTIGPLIEALEDEGYIVTRDGHHLTINWM